MNSAEVEEYFINAEKTNFKEIRFYFKVLLMTKSIKGGDF